MTTKTDDVTSTLVRHFTSGHGSVTQRLRDAIQETLKETGRGGWIDSQRLADFVAHIQRKPGADRQTLDNTQHCLREAYHVCRRGNDGMYRLHPEEACSIGCFDPKVMKPKDVIITKTCPNCFLAIPTCGVCNCEDQ